MKTDFARELRKNQTDAERTMWFQLRNRRFSGFKFKRQRPIGPFIVDFCCLEKRLIIELDGGQHSADQDYDERRTQFLEKKGFRVIRFWNHDVLARTEVVMDDIWKNLIADLPSP